MTTKERVLDALLTASPVSGATLAQRLGVSRTAIWKAVEELRGEGYRISSAPHRGYTLAAEQTVFTAQLLKAHLRHRELQPEVYATLPSTNTALKARAEQGAPEGLTLLAEQQTAGRGRLGRSFYSPAETGLYMSLLLRPQLPAQEVTALTCCAAAAVAESIEALTGAETQIKWVNDVFLGGKKVAGILTEGSLDCETGFLRYAVVGIGVNLTPPAGGFPPELAQIAGGIGEVTPALRPRLAAAILDRLMDGYAALPATPFFSAYARRSLVLGKPVTILAPGKPPEEAVALGLEPDFSLRVRLADGTERRLSTGEVSVRML